MAIRTSLGACIVLALLCGSAPSMAADSAPLAKAIQHGSDKTAGVLIAAGTGINQVDEKGRGPLYYACARGDAGLIAVLLGKGANVDVADADADTPLIVLARNTIDVAEPAKALLARGANVNAQNKAGRTALMEAIDRSPGVLDFQAETRLVKLLLDAGADTSLRDGEGMLAAHHAAAVGQPMSMFKAVLARTAHPDAPDGEGLDVLLVAVQADHPNIARQMFQDGFTPSFAPPATAEGLAKNPTRMDDHAKVNATALTWYADYLAAQGKTEEATATYRGALVALDTAIKEDDRVADALGKVIADDRRKADNARMANLAINVAGIALTAATGAGGVLIMNPSARIDEDKARLASLAEDRAKLGLRRDSLHQKLDPKP